MNRHRMIRRGAVYGPHLPEDAPEDGVERGIAAFVICASLIRQFEFAQNVWVSDRNFHELGNERDPIIGTHDGTLEYKIPKRPIRRKITGLPAFTTVRGGAYFVPVYNQWGLCPALVKDTRQIAPLTTFQDFDKPGLLKDVPTLNFHRHLPHYEITEQDSKSVHVLARQPIEPDRPHPFTAAGNTEFNCLLWLPPNEQHAGDIVLVDSTHFTTLFGGTESLKNFWQNFALMN